MNFLDEQCERGIVGAIWLPTDYTWTTLYGPAPAPNHAMVNDICCPYAPNGLIYQCTTEGDTGAVEPTWGLVVGGTTQDNDAVWTCRGRIPLWDSYSVASGGSALLNTASKRTGTYGVEFLCGTGSARSATLRTSQVSSLTDVWTRISIKFVTFSYAAGSTLFINGQSLMTSGGTLLGRLTPVADGTQRMIVGYENSGTQTDNATLTAANLATLGVTPFDGSWHELETHLRISATAGIFEGWCDGVRLFSFQGLNNAGGAYTVGRLQLNAGNGNTANALDVYVDEITLAQSRIGTAAAGFARRRGRRRYVLQAATGP